MRCDGVGGGRQDEGEVPLNESRKFFINCEGTEGGGGEAVGGEGCVDCAGQDESVDCHDPVQTWYAGSYSVQGKSAPVPAIAPCMSVSVLVSTVGV